MSKLLVPLFTAIIVIGTMFYQAATPNPTICEPPDVHLAPIAGYLEKSVEISEAEKETLPKDTRIEKRLYTDSHGVWYCVSVVVGGSHKESIHRPELCLPAQGFLMINPRTVDVGSAVWRRLTLASNQGTNLGFAYTFFNQAGYHTESHIKRIFRDVWDRSFYNRIDRWVMVTVYSSTDDSRQMNEFLAKLREVVK